jgi:hypothetical protein
MEVLESNTKADNGVNDNDVLCALEIKYFCPIR